MQSIGFIVFPGFQLMGLSIATPFEMANMLAGEELYRIRWISEHGGLVTTSNGMAVDTDAFDTRTYDTLILCAKHTFEASSPGLLAFVRAAPERARRVATTCTGAFILAEAGLLDGRRATTHWHFANELKLRFPKVKVEEDRIFICDGLFWTSAGMTAGIDLALAMIERDLGEELSRQVARKLVVYHRRSGGQSQHSALLEIEPKSDRVQAALDYAKRHLHAELSVELLAEAVHLSPRQFSRTFHAETGHSPAKAIEKLRVETARTLIEQGAHSIDAVAKLTGFGERSRMRRAFLRAFGQPPQVIRRNAKAPVAA